ncbi:MAG: restriction endonuclease subunit S [Bacteroidales bacterium]|nr:restriction endonuclease subunit S [Bacteroidales bacterium]
MRTVRIGDVAKVTSGNSAPQEKRLFEGGIYPFVRTSDVGKVHRDSWFTHPEDYLNKEGISKLTLFPKKSILFPKSGASTLLNHRAMLGEDSYVSSHLAVIIPNESKVFPEYLYYATFVIDAGEMVDDPSYPSLRTAAIEDVEINFPSLDRQKSIAKELGLFAEIISEKEKQILYFTELSQSLFIEMFERAHESGENKSRKRLEEVCEIVSGLVDPTQEPYCNYPHIGGANIESGTGCFINVKSAKEENLISGKYLFDESMVLYSKIRPNLNKVALPSFMGICSADMYPIIPKTDVVNKYFLRFLLTQKDFIDYAIAHSGRANIPKINRQTLLNYSFDVYPLTIQNEFAAKVREIEKRKNLVVESLIVFKEIFNSRLTACFG